MRLLPSILALALLVGCEPASDSTVAPTVASTAAPAQTPAYSYPDLPGNIEDTIAEADCEGLDTVAAFMDRDAVDPIVRESAMAAILHRAEELGC